MAQLLLYPNEISDSLLLILSLLGKIYPVLYILSKSAFLLKFKLKPVSSFLEWTSSSHLTLLNLNIMEIHVEATFHCHKLTIKRQNYPFPMKTDATIEREACIRYRTTNSRGKIFKSSSPKLKKNDWKWRNQCREDGVNGGREKSVKTGGLVFPFSCEVKNVKAPKIK